MTTELVTIIVEKLLDWPFLFFILMIFVVFRFRPEISSWIKRIKEFEIGDGKFKFKIGKDEVPVENLGQAITDRLRDLESEIETLQASQSNLNETARTLEPNNDELIPEDLYKLLEKRIYRMLRSRLWKGRYVKTLASSTSVSEETILKFARSRDDIELSQVKDQWVATLQERLR